MFVSYKSWQLPSLNECGVYQILPCEEYLFSHSLIKIPLEILWLFFFMEGDGSSFKNFVFGLFRF